MSWSGEPSAQRLPSKTHAHTHTPTHTHKNNTHTHKKNTHTHTHSLGACGAKSQGEIMWRKRGGIPESEEVAFQISPWFPLKSTPTKHTLKKQTPSFFRLDPLKIVGFLWVALESRPTGGANSEKSQARINPSRKKQPLEACGTDVMETLVGNPPFMGKCALRGQIGHLLCTHAACCLTIQTVQLSAGASGSSPLPFSKPDRSQIQVAESRDLLPG